MEETLFFGEKDKITLKGYEKNEVIPEITVSKLFAEVSGLFNCTSFNLKVKSSIGILYKIKTSINSGGTVYLKNIDIKCKIYSKIEVALIALL